MKYLLINKQTAEESLCDKVTIDGLDYYACRGEIGFNDPVTDKYRVWFWKDDCSLLGIKKVIATNNPNIDIPQVVDEVEEINLAFKQIACTGNSQFDSGVFHGFVACYHKSQETHPFSEGDLIDFLNWVRDNCVFDAAPKPYYQKTQERLTQQELLQLWKEQKPKKVYYTQTAQP